VTDAVPGWRRPLIAALAASAAAGALVLRGEPLRIDRWSLEVLVAHRGATATGLAVAAGLLGSGMVLYPLLLALVVLRGPRHRLQALLAVAALAVAQLLHDVLLAGVAFPRPAPGLHLTVAAGAATASGHAMTAVVGWGLLAAQLGRSRRTVYAVAGAAGLLVGAARAYLAVHWLSDAIAGLLLGFALLTVTVAVLLRPSPPPSLAALIMELSAVSTASPGRELHDQRGGSGFAGGVGADGWPEIRWPRPDRRWIAPGLGATVALVPIVLTAPGDRMKDLLVYAGSAAAAGTGADVYAYRTPFGMPFTYPPFAAVLVEPLSRIPPGLLQVLWAAATVALLIPLANVALAPVVRRIGLPWVLTLLLISAPIRSHLRFGQVGVLLVLLVAADTLRAGRGGWGVGLAAAVKLTPAVFVPWMFVTGGLRGRGLRTVAWAAAATVTGVVLLWPSSPSYLLQAAWDSDRFGDNAVAGNQSLRGALLRSGLPHAQLGWLAAVVVLVVIGTVNARRLERASDRLGAVGVLAALSVAVSPITWVHHLVWLTLPIAALVRAGRMRWAVGWYLLLAVSVPSLGMWAGRHWPMLHPLWAVVVDLQGLSAVAAVLVLPRLLGGLPTPPTLLIMELMTSTRRRDRR